jgi:ABC-type amino acid transport substrate-binding protein
VSIASIDGATAEIIAQEDFPKVRRVSLPQLSDFGQLLLTVSTGKADITFTEPADAAIFMRNNPGAVERVGPPVRVFPNCFIFRRGQMEFKCMIDTALSQLINSGTMDKILKKYEPAPNTLYRVAVPYAAPAWR